MHNLVQKIGFKIIDLIGAIISFLFVATIRAFFGAVYISQKISNFIRKLSGKEPKDYKDVPFYGG